MAPDVDIETVARTLRSAAVEAAPSWVRRVVAEVAVRQGLDLAEAEGLIVDAGERAARFVDERLGALLGVDIDQQRSTPLSVFRDAARFPVEVLHQLGATEVHRVDVERWAAPNDPFAVTPANLADVGADVHDAGIMWGATKAAIHLQRRRDEGLR